MEGSTLCPNVVGPLLTFLSQQWYDSWEKTGPDQI